MNEGNTNSISRLDKFSEESNLPSEDSKKILIVEDNPILVKLYSTYLKKLFFVDVAYNGLDAIKKVAKVKPHLILLDIMMPGLDGFSVAQQLHDERITIPVIVLTVKHLSQAETDLLQRLGIKSFFQKDEMTQAMLIEEIQKYI